jgi:hypothetical protein
MRITEVVVVGLRQHDDVDPTIGANLPVPETIGAGLLHGIASPGNVGDKPGMGKRGKSP